MRCEGGFSYEQVEKGILDIYFSGIVCLTVVQVIPTLTQRSTVLEWDRVREKICRTTKLYHNADG